MYQSSSDVGGTKPTNCDTQSSSKSAFTGSVAQPTKMMETSDTHGKMSKACDDVSSEQVRGSANTLSFPIVTYLNVPIQIFLTIRGHKFGPFSSEFLMKNLIRKDLKLLKAKCNALERSRDYFRRRCKIL